MQFKSVRHLTLPHQAVNTHLIASLAATLRDSHKVSLLAPVRKVLVDQKSERHVMGSPGPAASYAANASTPAAAEQPDNRAGRPRRYHPQRLHPLTAGRRSGSHDADTVRTRGRI